MNLLVSALKEILNQEVNPIKRFCLEAFIKNYDNKVMQSVLETSIRRAESMNGKALNIDQLMVELVENTFTLLPQRTQDQVQWFKKNAELMEKSPHREFLFQYYKMQIEGHLLAMLEDNKLEKYVEALKQEPDVLHLPCSFPDCIRVMTTRTFLNLDALQYCEVCKQKSVKP